MTQLCYSIQEAANIIDMSEPVLVRLSQFFKVPENAYEDTGYLSFKGDLVFNDDDIHFFKQVKNRILQGETIETIRDRIQFDGQPRQSHSQMSQSVDLSEKSSFVQHAKQSMGIENETQRNEAPQGSDNATQSKRGKNMLLAKDNSPIGLSGFRASEDEAVNYQPAPSYQGAIHQNLETIEEPGLLQQAAEQSLAQFKLRKEPLHNTQTLEDLAAQSQHGSAQMPYVEPASEALNVPSWKDQFKKVIKSNDAPPVKPSLKPNATVMPQNTPAIPAGNDARYVQQVENQRREEVRQRLDQLKQKLNRNNARTVGSKTGATTPWQSLINEGQSQQREATPRLQQAAAMLKEKAMKKTPAYHNF